MWKPIKISKGKNHSPASPLSKKAKFLLDQNMPLQIAKNLKMHKINATHLSQLGKEKIDDKALFSLAREIDRVLVTGDHDFLDDHQYPLKLSPGIIVIDGSLRVSEVQHRLRRMARLKDTFNKSKMILHEDTLTLRYLSDGFILNDKFRFQRNKPVEIWEE